MALHPTRSAREHLAPKAGRLTLENHMNPMSPVSQARTVTVTLE